MKALTAAALGLCWSDIMIMLYEVMLWLDYDFVMVAALAAVSARREAVLWLPCQPGENKHVCSFTAPHIFFQPLSPRLAYHHFSKQCSQ